MRPMGFCVVACCCCAASALPRPARRQRRAPQRGRRPQLGRLRPHLQRNPLQPAGRDQSRDRAAAESRLDAGSRRHQQPVDAAGGGRRDLRRLRLQLRACGRREDRQAAVALRPRGRQGRGRQAAHRLGHPRPELLEGPAVRRHARRPPDRARCEDRQAGVERADHRHRTTARSSPARRACSTTR